MTGQAPTGTILTRRQVFAQSWPIILANAAIGLTGLVDTFVIGRFSTTSALAGMGLGAAIYATIYWGFGFLRMTTAGLSAQAEGAEDENAVQLHLYRAVPLGMALGFVILVLQILLIPLALYVFTADPSIETSAAIYVKARLWGLPAYLGLIAIMGWFIGLGRARHALAMQIVLNGVNILLSFLFVGGLSLGLQGVAWATAIAEWLGLACGIMLAVNVLTKRGGVRRALWRAQSLLDAAELGRLGRANGNIFIRTAALTLGFSFFSNAAAGQGETFLAAHHIHLQFITLSAFILDGFANTAEAAVGAAYGARSRDRFSRAVRLTSEFAFIFGFICAAVIFLAGYLGVSLITKDAAVLDTALKYLPYCALAPLLGAAAFQLDGVFIGTTRTREMRNAGIAALGIYLIAHFALPVLSGGETSGHTIWTAFLIYYLARAATLLYYYPRVRPG